VDIFLSAASFSKIIIMHLNRGKEEEKRFRKISRKVRRAVYDHRMIEEGDRVLLGLSGGKDSMILLEVLTELKSSLPFKFEIFVAHIIPENTGYKTKESSLIEMVGELGIELIIKKVSPDFSRNEKDECFVCSWHRRKALFDLTKSLNCNKLALGHHRDDALETALMNMIYHGSISSMPYSLSMFEGRMDLIRPLLNCWEKELFDYSALRNYQAIEKQCNYEDFNQRNFAADLITMIEKEKPGAKRNLFHALGNIYPEYLPQVKKSLRS